MEIETFWRSHPEFWIPITAAQKAVADKEIYDNFWDFNYESQTLVGRVIYLDQFQRHFQRILGPVVISEALIAAQRQEAVEDVERNADELICCDEQALVFCLMPFKHVGRYEFIFEYIHGTWLPDMGWSERGEEAEKLKAYPVLSRFYKDTYTKAYTDSRVAADIFKAASTTLQEDHSAVCESNARPALPLQLPPCAATAAAVAALPLQPVAVSLSGGVDSMVALTLLKALGRDPVAIHIIYGNRGESYYEYALIADYCKYIDVPLHVYEIPYIKRDSVEREFYERATRDLRFSVYRAIGLPVILGHIQDDVVENIWTNFAKCQHLGNLAKMEAAECQQGVELLRPFLGLPKTVIMEIATEMGIPHLKNTTPAWSNRGKFRAAFYEATHEQFGEEVDKKVMQVAGALKAQAALIDRLLYDQIFASWSATARQVDVTPALIAELDADGWLRIFEHVCHKLLGVPRPSIHAIREFLRRMKKADQAVVPMTKQLQVVYKRPFLTFRILE